MNVRRIREELVLVFSSHQEGRSLSIAIRRQVTTCPELSERAAHTEQIVAIVQRCCLRVICPEELKARLLESLPHRCDGQRAHDGGPEKDQE